MEMRRIGIAEIGRDRDCAGIGQTFGMSVGREAEDHDVIDRRDGLQACQQFRRKSFLPYGEDGAGQGKIPGLCAGHGKLAGVHAFSLDD